MNKCSYCAKDTNKEPIRKGGKIMCDTCTQTLFGIMRSNKKDPQ